MKLKTTHVMALCALSLFATQSAWADAPVAGIATLKVRGIIEPASCDVKLDTKDQAEVELEKLSPNAISSALIGTPLTQKQVALTVDCQAATLVGFRLKDNKPKNVVKDIILPVGKNNVAGTRQAGVNDFGLGSDEETPQNIGTYGIVASKWKVGENTDVIPRGGLVDNILWSSANGMTTIDSNLDNLGQYYFWLDPKEKVPLRGKSFSTEFTIGAAIAPSGTLTLTNKLTYGGDATVTVYYL